MTLTPNPRVRVRVMVMVMVMVRFRVGKVRKSYPKLSNFESLGYDFLTFPTLNLTLTITKWYHFQ